MRTTSIATCGSLLTLRPLANSIRRINHHQTRRFIASSQISIQTQKTLATTLAGKSQQPSTFSFVSWYATQLSQYPLVTKALTGGAIAAGGDLCCQTILEGSNNDDDNDNGQSTTTRWKEYDPWRTFRFAFLGTFFVAPTNHVWYRFLAKHAAPGKTWSSAWKRTALDQFGWTPVYTVIWLSSLWKMEGTNNTDIAEALGREYLGVMKANWILWIPAQLANFKLIPLKYQVLFTNVVELVWNAFLSFAATGKGEEKEAGNARQNRKRHQTVVAS